MSARWIISALVLAALTVGATELVWQPRISLETNSTLALVFNNTRAVVRSRDGQRVYLGWKTTGGLYFAVLTNNAVAGQVTISTNLSANALTVEETPSGKIVAAYSQPGAVIVMESTNHGASFTITATNSAPGPQVSPSLSYSPGGDGYLIWHSATTPTVLYGSIRTNGAANWSTPTVLETNLENPQFASVWARGNSPVAVWRADADPSPSVTNWNIRFLDWTNGATPVTLPTTNCFDPSVFSIGERTVASWFNLQKINVAMRTNAAANFSPAQTFPAYGRFPQVLGNARSVIACYYEYSDVTGMLTDDSVKKVGLMVSFDHGVSFTNAAPADLTNITYQTFATGWVSDGWLDLLWIDRSADVLRYQSANIVYPPEISSITRDSTNAVISFFGSPGKSYSLEYKDDLSATNWTAHPVTPVNGNGSTQSLTVDLTTPAQRFFRLVHQ